MSLPEPSFIERDAIKITQEIISQYEQMTGKKLYPAQVERILVDLIAYREMLVRIGIQEAAKQNLVEYARYPMLDYLGELVGVQRLPAQPAMTKIRFYVDETKNFDVLIPAGTQIETKDGKYIFETVKDCIIKSGLFSADVLAYSNIATTSANGYLPGEINTPISIVPYVSKMENVTVSYGGADEENDDRLRERIREAPESFSNAGSKGAYRFWVMSAHQDIVDVAILSPTPGVVNVYPLTIDGVPSGEILDKVNNILGNEKIRPLTDMVVVMPPTKVDFRIVANVIVYSFADADTVRNNINSNITNYISDMKKALGKDIVRSQIITLINSVYGVYKVDLVEPADTEMLDFCFANCTDYIINLAGVVHG